MQRCETTKARLIYECMQLGTAYIALKPIGNLLQNPRTAVLVVLAFVGLIFFLKTTLTAMLGTSDPLILQ